MNSNEHQILTYGSFIFGGASFIHGLLGESYIWVGVGAVLIVLSVALASRYNLWPWHSWSFVDEFDRQEIGGAWEIMGVGWRIRDGRLEVHYDPPDQNNDWRHAWLRSAMKQERVRIVCEFGIERQYAEFGVSLCTRDTADKYSGYHFWFWQDGVKLAKPGQPMVHHDSRWTLCSGQVYRLELQKDGGRLSARIDGQPCFEYADPEHAQLYQSGRRFIGFGFNFNDGWIDNVRVRAE